MAVDSTGAMVIAGAAGGDVNVGTTAISGGGFEKSVFIIKLDADGDIIWSKVEQIANIDYVGTAGIALDPNDGIIVAGYANAPADLGGQQFGGSTDGDFFAVRLHADGQHDWTQVFTAVGFLSGPTIEAMTTSPAGDVFVFGTLYNGDRITLCNKTLMDGGGAFFGFKLAANGSCQWAYRWLADGTMGAIATDGPSVFITGSFEGTLDFGENQMSTAGPDSDMFVAALDAQNGSHLWSKDFGDGAMQFRQGIAVHTGGDILLAGYAAGNIDFGGETLTGSMDDDMTFARLSSAGAHVSSARYGDSSTQRARAIAASPSGRWCAAGEVAGTLDLGTVSLQTTGLRPATTSFHEAGTALWAASIATPMSGNPGPSRLGVAPNGSVVVLSPVSTYNWRLVRYSP